MLQPKNEIDLWDVLSDFSSGVFAEAEVVGFLLETMDHISIEKVILIAFRDSP
jgi:hypothetical protein